MPEAETNEDPFPESLCYRCAAPIKLIRTKRSTFLYCPVLKRYPPQPISACEKFTPKENDEREPGNS
ncbi:MAG TPA: hypothetical protein VKJ00_11050 [Thermoanaerobaculia bacterium]|nr:hypothetical protein [Thermoanaerobaculia bacterium]